MAATKYLQEGIVSSMQTGISPGGFSVNENSAATPLPSKIHLQIPLDRHYNPVNIYPSGWWIIPCIGLGLYMWVIILNFLFNLVF